MKVEAESNELVLRNDKGVVIIIPKNRREEALKHLSRGDYEAIDSIAQELPLAEEYETEVRADDGVIVPDDNKDPKKTKTTSTTPLIPKGIYTEEEYKELAEKYEKAPYVKFGQLQNPDNPNSGYGCLGSSCTNFKILYPQFPSHYEDFSKVGLYTKGVHTDDNPSYKSSSNTPGVDSWEWIPAMLQYNLGKVLYNFDLDKETIDPDSRYERLHQLRQLDQRDIPLGAMLNFGSAKKAGYIHPKAKSFRGLDEPLYKHTMIKLGDIETVDDQGNPVVESFYDENGRLVRVGNSPGSKPWEQLIQELGGISYRNSVGDWTYYKMKGIKKEKNTKKDTFGIPQIDAMIEETKRAEQETIKRLEKSGVLSPGSATSISPKLRKKRGEFITEEEEAQLAKEELNIEVNEKIVKMSPQQAFKTFLKKT